MPCAVNMGSTPQCVVGAAPMPMTVLPTSRVMAGSMPLANMSNMTPFMNVMPFAICSILTATALGVPIPCAPATVAPWTLSAMRVMTGGQPTVAQISMTNCAIGGMVMVNMPGQMQVQVSAPA